MNGRGNLATNNFTNPFPYVEKNVHTQGNKTYAIVSQSTN